MPLVKSRLLWPMLLMVVLALTRWPGLMPPNFSAVYGLLFCAGVYLPGRWAWGASLLTLFVTDVLINWYYHVALINSYMLANYAVYLLIVGLGRWFSPRSSWFSLLGGGLLGALSFYLITNTIAWIQNPEYLKTLAGWIQALTTGTPGWPHTWQFFFNTLMSGGLFTGLFAGAMKWAEATEPKEEKEESSETAPEEAEPEAATQPAQPEESSA
jgi:hypothetical protein